MKISDCRAFSPFKTLPDCRAFRHSDKNIGIQVRQFPIHSILPSIPFLIFDRDHLRSNMGIICGPGSFAVLGSFADPYSSQVNVVMLCDQMVRVF